MLSLLRRGVLSLAAVSLVASSVSAEVFEKLRSVPDGWKYSHHPNGDQPLRLQIALQQHNADGFEQRLLDVSTPDHPDYGKHFRTHDEMKRMLQPSDQAVSAVRDWLQDAGVHDVEQDADWIRFHTTVDHANNLLQAEFLWYVNQVRPDTHRLRTLEYSIPDAVAPHVNMIQPTTRFGQIHANRATHTSRPQQMDDLTLSSAATKANLTICDKAITPACLKFLYNIGDYVADPASGSKVGFASYLEQNAQYADLELFEEKLAPYAKGQNFTVIMYNGGKNNQSGKGDNGEANLDLQYMLGLSSPLPVTEFSTAGRAPVVPDADEPDPKTASNEPYLEFLQNVLKMDQHQLPQVISTSYGEDEQTIPEKYARTVCNLYAQLGSRGVSVIFSSGDSGVGSACVTNDGSNRTHFPPQFPGSCPYVTTVGATHHTAPEEATFFSSGGFSDLFARPRYQDSAVDTFLHDHLGSRYKGLFNASGRGFPDVSAQGMSYAVYDQGALGQFDGTSCAAPAFGGIIGLLNDARLRAGQPVLGFLNPWLYSGGRKGLNDIVRGASTGCDGNMRFGGKSNGSPVVANASWNATQGWDPVTGLGTPDFGRLVKLALEASK